MVSAMALANARVIRWVGVRWSALLGISILGISEIACSFLVRNIVGLFFTAGLILGIGKR